MELPHFNRTLTSIISGSILAFTLVLSFPDVIKNLFDFENNKIAKFYMDDKESKLILYPQNNYYSTPEKFVIKNYNLTTSIDPKVDITYKVHSFFPIDFVKLIIFITLLALIYITGEYITTLADLILWFIFKEKFLVGFLEKFLVGFCCILILACCILFLCIFFNSIFPTLIFTILIVLYLSILKNLYDPFISKVCPKLYNNNETSNDYIVEYIVDSCSLTVDDFIKVANQTDNFFLQESDRYFDYSLFFGSISLTLLISVVIIGCKSMLNYQLGFKLFYWKIIFLFLFIISFCLAIYNRFRANLFLKLAAKSIESIEKKS